MQQLHRYRIIPNFVLLELAACTLEIAILSQILQSHKDLHSSAVAASPSRRSQHRDIPGLFGIQGQERWGRGHLSV